MSRIKQGAVVDGETIGAADLNTRFTDYTQTDLNAFNTRDAAVDLPQITGTDFLVPFLQADDIGKSDLFAAAPITVTGIAALPSSGYVVGDGSADTIASFGAGLAITSADVLRVYWHLNVNPIFTGTPWTAAGGIDYYEFALSGGGTQNVATNGTVWGLYLQWDITDATLTNWTEPDYQGDFTTVAGAETGSLLADCMATSVTPCWITHQSATTSRELTGSEVAVAVNWRAVSGSYYYTPAAGTTTVYGLRLVIKGPLHPWNNGGANYLVHTLGIMSGTNVQLEYTSGTISTIKQRLS